MNGCLTGLVSITAGCATVEPWAAVLIGIAGGWFYLLGSWALVKLRIDDAVDAIPVHMVGGAWGVIATGLFTEPALLEAAFPDLGEHFGWFYAWTRSNGDFTLLGIQLLAVLFVFGWTFVVMGIYFKILNYFNLLRIDPLEEAVGMDISYHKGSAYNIEDPNKEYVEQLDLSRSGHKTKFSLSKKDKEEIVAPDEGEAGDYPNKNDDGDADQEAS